jgi:hypothetical protein
MSDSSQDQPQYPTEPVSVYTIIMSMVEQMAAVSWQKMGLQPDMITGKTAKNLDEAKVAVDVTAGLAAFLQPELDDDDKKRIHNLITDLKMNYVEKRREDNP